MGFDARDHWRVAQTASPFGFHDVGAWEGVTRFYQELMASSRALKEVCAINSLRVVRCPG